MVRGLEHFKKYFEDFADQYVLIGGVACSVVLDGAGLDFRVTKDLDIVLCVETLNDDFVSQFWDYVKSGRYETRQKSTGKKLFYRFYDPKDKSFPEMLELFSRKPDALDIGEDSRLTPIPAGEELSSLSAILLDDEYYALVSQTKTEIDGLPIVPEHALIPFKAKAWLNLVEQSASGENVDSGDIKKHRNDVFRLFRLLAPESSFSLPDSIQNDLKTFLNKMVEEEFLNLKDLGYKTIDLETILGTLKKIYQIND